MPTARQRVEELTASIGAKMNVLHADKEDKSNKQIDLTSTNPAHYPNVPAVKNAINDAGLVAQQYVDAALAALPAYILLNQKGSVNGVAELDATGKVPSSQLPSYVDDVVDIQDFVTTNPSSGMTPGQKWYNSTVKKIFTAVDATTGTTSDPEGDKLYIKISDNTTHRWSGTTMVNLGNGNSGLVLGGTSSTAHRGDHGVIAYNHTSLTNNPHNVTKAQVGLGNVDNTSDMNKPVSTAQAAADAVIQNDLNDFRTNHVGTNFPDYSAQLLAILNF